MVWMILRIVSAVLRLANLALIVYCIMSFVMPQHELYRKAAYYMERVLHPIRSVLYRWFPALYRLPVDISPLVLWFLIDLAMSLVNMIGRMML